MRIVLAGIVGRYPWGGVTWCSLMYLLGLRELGHDVWYLEDTCECNYDPEIEEVSTEPSYALRYIHQSLAPFGFGDRWCYVDYTGAHHGLTEVKMREICRTADLFLVLSGGCWIWRDHYREIPCKAFIDSDPGFTQLAIENARKAEGKDEKKNWYVEFFNSYDYHFTFGSRIGTSQCSIPSAGIEWLPTWQPISTEFWSHASVKLPSRSCYSTIMTWQIESFQDIGGNKDVEFLKVIDLSKQLKDKLGVEVELAVSGTRHLLEKEGWRCIDAYTISSDIWRYHNYISTSRAEFSVAKHTYVAHRTGWFSDRTECYLASGKPAVVQDTGFSEVLPTGEGLFAWSNGDQALAAIDKIDSEYAKHAKAAREVALEHFEAEKVLSSLLNRLEIQ